MQNLDNNSIEQLIIIFYIINYFNGDFNYKKILNTTDQANRFEILNLFESYIENTNNEIPQDIYSNDNLTKAIQKSVSKRAINNLNIKKQTNIYNQMITDIKDKFGKILGVKNFILLDDSFPIDDLLISYLYKSKGEIKFKTNDTELFTNVPEVFDSQVVNIINTNKQYNISENSIFYIPKLKKEHLNFIRNSNFIIDLKENIHKINGFRIVCLNDYNVKDSTFNFNKICKLWSTLSYLGINSLID